MTYLIVLNPAGQTGSMKLPVRLTPRDWYLSEREISVLWLAHRVFLTPPMRQILQERRALTDDERSE